MNVRDVISMVFVLLMTGMILFLHLYEAGDFGSVALIILVICFSVYAIWQRVLRKRMLHISVETIKKNLLGDYITLEQAVKTSSTIKKNILQVKDNSREGVYQLLKNELDKNEAYLGVWAAYEKNGFDGKDSTLGRMNPYYYRKEGKISYMPLDTIDEEEFYTRPLKSGTIEILEPFYFNIEGQDVLMTTVANPIKQKGKAIGVVGIDVLLKDAKTIYRDLIFFKNKYKPYRSEDLIALLTKNRSGLHLLGYAIEAGTKNQEEMINLLSMAASSLTKISGEMSTRNHDLSQRVLEQASSLEEIAATIEELVTTIGQNAKNATVATNLSGESENKAKEGGQVVQEAISAINEINVSSQKIEEIITVINDIAFQTNLLALNASVEAARAGEEGRGFAVVAGEVRNLAQLSANAAKEISALIKETIHKVDGGTALANQSGESLVAILDSINEVSTFIRDISKASEEQRLGAEQISSAVQELDTVTQQNSGLVEQTVSVSEEMAVQAKELQSMVEKYRVK